MKKTAGLLLVAAILTVSASLFYYAFRPGAPGVAPAGPAPAPEAVPPYDAPAPPPGEDAGEALAPAGTGEVAVSPFAPSTPSEAPAPPSGPVEPSGLSVAGKKLSGNATVTGDVVNVRGTNEFRTDRANVVAKVNRGDRVKLLGAEKEKAGPHTWYHVRMKDGTVGWIRDDLLKVE